jgi:D-sedoheptulose 7-phosphate isomerase
MMERATHERLVDYAVVVRSDYIPRIQEVQASIYHVLRGLLEELQG